MRRGLRFAGHPVHAMLSDFPMVLLLLWVALDAAALLLASSEVWRLGRWALTGGVVAAGLAATAGLVDYSTISEAKPNASQVATAHMMVMLSVAVIAILALVFRSASLPQDSARVLHVVALVLVASGLAGGGWLGGHLVFRHGVGVD
jgi:uncharacterized membrane protein